MPPETDIVIAALREREKAERDNASRLDNQAQDARNEAATKERDATAARVRADKFKSAITTIKGA